MLAQIGCAISLTVTIENRAVCALVYRAITLLFLHVCCLEHRARPGGDGRAGEDLLLRLRAQHPRQEPTLRDTQHGGRRTHSERAVCEVVG